MHLYDCSFLFGYDDGEEMLTTNLGYRIAYRSDNIVQKDLVYVAGNNYLFKDFKLSVEQRIDPDLLYVFNPKNRKDLVSLFGWTMDLRDEKLFRKCCSEDIHIFRAGIDGYHYELNGINDCCSFMKKDREYFRNNTYSLVVEKENDNEVLAYHLYPANTGNKHLGSNTRYVQFFNEDITFAFNDDQISEIRFKRKERPIVKRDQIIIL